MKKEILINHIQQVVKKGGPNWLDYAELEYIIKELGVKIKSGEIQESEINILKSQCQFLSDESSIMGHILNKPFGYAGDFMIIDKIYTHTTSLSYYKWDDFSLNNSAAVAVKNRKAYFKKTVPTVLREGKLLNLASGPCRDVCELLDENPQLNIKITCIEMDKNAIQYAQELNQQHLGHIEFINKNIFRFKPLEKYNMIWSAGLFDYFSDKSFVSILKKSKEWIAPGGEIIIGNFNENYNPSRTYMELFGEWYLNHRTADDLKKLAIAAGYSMENISIDREPENVNLFLRIKAPQI